jgi:hypothetical protein
MSARNPEEFNLHCFVADLLKFQRAPGVVYFHPANGEKRPPRTAARLKRMGLVRGVPDFVIIMPGRTAFLELKRGGGRLSPEQKAFKSAVESCGCAFSVASTPEQANKILIQWGAVSQSEPFTRRAA